jgi:hypothetical protein
MRWSSLGKDCRDAVLVAERFADGEADIESLKRAHESMISLRDRERSLLKDDSGLATLIAATDNDESQEDGWSLSFGHRHPFFTPTDFSWQSLRIMLEIVGRPEACRDVNQDWLTTDVAAAAHRLYQQNGFNDISPQYDILTKSGCTNDDIMNHCKRPDGHVRGCWVIDLLRSH